MYMYESCVLMLVCQTKILKLRRMLHPLIINSHAARQCRARPEFQLSARRRPKAAPCPYMVIFVKSVLCCCKLANQRHDHNKHST